MKKTTCLFISMALFLAVIFAAVPKAEASSDIQILKNGQPIAIPADIQPFIENGRVFVPLRFIGEWYHCDVNWEKESKYGSGAVFVTKRNSAGSDVTYVFLADTYRYLVVEQADAGADITEMDINTAPKNINGRVFVPLRTMGELFGTVEWEEKSRSVLLGTSGTSISNENPITPPSAGGNNTQPFAYLTQPMQKQLETFGPLEQVSTLLIEPVLTSQALFDAACMLPADSCYYNNKYGFKVNKPSIWGSEIISHIGDGAIIYNKDGWDIRAYGFNSLGEQPEEYFSDFYHGNNIKFLGMIENYPCYSIIHGDNVKQWVLFDTGNEQAIAFYVKPGIVNLLPFGTSLKEDLAYIQMIAEDAFWSYAEAH